MAAIQPMEQFMIHKVVDLPPVNIPVTSGLLDLSITNSVVFMLVAAAVATLRLLQPPAAKGAVVPGRTQAVGEMVYDLVDKGMTGSMIGSRGRPFLPFVFTLFSLIAVMNVIGLLNLVGVDQHVHGHLSAGGPPSPWP